MSVHNKVSLRNNTPNNVTALLWNKKRAFTTCPTKEEVYKNDAVVHALQEKNTAGIYFVSENCLDQTWAESMQFQYVKCMECTWIKLKYCMNTNLNSH